MSQSQTNWVCTCGSSNSKGFCPQCGAHAPQPPENISISNGRPTRNCSSDADEPKSKSTKTTYDRVAQSIATNAAGQAARTVTRVVLESIAKGFTKSTK